MKAQEPIEASCSCSSGIPIQKVRIGGQIVSLLALPIIFQQFHASGKPLNENTAREILDSVKVYNHIPVEQESLYLNALQHEYAVFCAKQEAAA